MGIAPYLGKPVTGLDTSFQPPFHPLLQREIGSGEKIPFGDKSFSVVISVDTLEHVPPSTRPKIIQEMIRVARKMVIVAVPTGEKSHNQDRYLAEYFKRKFGREFPFFCDHVKYGLPSKGDLEKSIAQSLASTHRSGKVTFVGNENLSLRLFLMKGWITTNLFEDFFHRKILLLALPFLKFFEKPPFYRTIAVVKLIL